MFGVSSGKFLGRTRSDSHYGLHKLKTDSELRNLGIQYLNLVRSGVSSGHLLSQKNSLLCKGGRTPDAEVQRHV